MALTVRTLHPVDAFALPVAAAKRLATPHAPAANYPDLHSREVAKLAVSIAEQMRLSSAQRAAISLGALLHDLGKLALDEAILAKPAKLDDDELRHVRRHPAEGERMVQHGVAADVAAIVRSHHERWDGGGYPDSLCAAEIPLEARVVAVADAFCAMLEPRPYRKPVGRTQALAEVKRCAGTQFDPACVEALLAVTTEPDRYLRALPEAPQ